MFLISSQIIIFCHSFLSLHPSIFRPPQPSAPALKLSVVFTFFITPFLKRNIFYISALAAIRVCPGLRRQSQGRCGHSKKGCASKSSSNLFSFHTSLFAKNATVPRGSSSTPPQLWHAPSQTHHQHLQPSSASIWWSTAEFTAREWLCVSGVCVCVCVCVCVEVTAPLSPCSTVADVCATCALGRLPHRSLLRSLTRSSEWKLFSPALHNLPVWQSRREKTGSF